MNYVKGLAALAMTAVLAGCHKFDTIEQYRVSEEEALANAELALGFEIDPNQSWNMTAKGIANVTVNEGLGETYNVKVYSNNPMTEEVGYVLAQGDVQNGQTFTADITYPSGASKLVVSITNSKGYTFYRYGAIENGALNVTFGDSNPSAAPRRSQEAPVCPDINQPYNEAWVTTYCQTATEPTSSNVSANDANATLSVSVEPVMPSVDINNTKTNDGYYNRDRLTSNDLNFFDNTLKALWEDYNGNWSNVENSWYNNVVPYITSRNAHIDKFYAVYNAVVAYAGEKNVSDWLIISQMPSKGSYSSGDFVTNFKITGTYNGNIPVAASEGYAYTEENGERVYGDRLDPFTARTIVVKGTWNVTEDQRIGSGGLIVIANGGKIDVKSGKTLTMVNMSRIVVLPGGELKGEGNVLVTNGNAAGAENYNGGTIDIHKFDNNFGKFYNYGTFKADIYAASSKESNFYNHHIVHIKGTKENGNYVSPNARLFNACQWYCEGDMNLRNYEGVQGSSLLVDGELKMGSSADGTTDATYVGLEDGAYVECGTLFNNGTSWTGPEGTTEDGYAVVKIGQITYLNWEQDTQPLDGGYFENNIYVEIVDDTNYPTGNGWQTWNAAYKFWNIVANGLGGGTEVRGNGHVTEISSGTTEIIPEDITNSQRFEKGVRGCTPGYKGDAPEREDENPIYSYAFEDTKLGDYDLNDVVIKVQESTDNQYIDLRVVACGATLNLNIRLYPATTVPEGVVAVYPEEEEGFEVLKYTRDGVECDEVHAMLGVDPGTMVNTGWGNNKARPITIRIPKGSYNPAHLPLAIYSVAQGEVRLSGSGTAPYGVVIPKNWSWPYETRKVHNIYNATQTANDGDQSFETFSSQAGQAESWYDHPTGDVLNEKTLGY